MALEATTALLDVAAATGGRVVSGPAGLRVAGVTIDSRRVEPGQLFVAIAGPRFDAASGPLAPGAEAGGATVLKRTGSPKSRPAGEGGVDCARAVPSAGAELPLEAGPVVPAAASALAAVSASTVSLVFTFS